MNNLALNRMVAMLFMVPQNVTQQSKAARFGHKGIPVILQQSAAALGLLVISPLLLLTMLFIRMESQGPVFFTQVRVGENGRRFHCYKFRSMYLKTDPKYREPEPSDSDREGVCKKYYNDPRITRVGKFIRKYSIDELPQLLNVLKGDMMLIGPRPHLTTEYDNYDRNIMPRLYCKPGLTGLWQVNGRADTDFEQQLQFDKDYIQQQSIWLDIKILLATVPAVLGAKGAY
ncbi:sugar transferase [Planctobacterium marinum]|uniref:Multidrug MFS transporter n=1 Tax=Planctobacterium marinum TaxID=1631968 RepID=A0AA48HUK5_9ALTE|nr:multidrug MFS transporter [Planctobacterium marinum]